MYVSLYVKYQLFLSYFNGSRRFSTDLLRTVQIRNVMKIRVGAELFHSDGQTDWQTERQTNKQTDRRRDRHDEANSRFSQFCKRANQCCYSNAVICFAVVDVKFQYFDLIRDRLILSIYPRCRKSTAINQLTYESDLQFLQYLQHPAYVVYI